MGRGICLLRFFLLGVLLVASIAVSSQRLSAQAGGASQSASLVLHNGKVITVDANFSMAQAVAVRGNKIIAVGGNADVLKLAGPDTQVIDLKGRSVIPGLIDTHRHMYGAAEADYGGNFTPRQLHRYLIDFRGVENKEDVLNQIQGWMQKYSFPPGEWLYFSSAVGLSGTEEAGAQNAKILFNDLNRYELDKVAPNNPMILSLGIPDFNGILVNSKAIDIIWKDYGDFLKRNGRYWIDQSGRPEGHLESPATRLALYYSYNRESEVLGQLYKWDAEELDSMGLITISTRLPRDSVAAYQWLAKRGELGIRVSAGQIENFGTFADPRKQLKEAAKLLNAQDDWVWFSSVSPSSIDGSTSRACTNQKRVGTWTAIDSWYPVGQCYLDQEFRGAAGKAAPIQGNYFKDWLFASAETGARFANTHVAGDRAVNLLVTTMEDIQKKFGRDATKGWASDHCTLVDPADFKRIARVGLVMSCLVANSVDNSEGIAKAYGDKVANTFLSPLKSMMEAGVKVVFETDRNSYVWEDLVKAVTRKDNKGNVWAPQERVDRATALKMATLWAADYVLKPDKLGSIESGKLADLVVLDRDYLTVPEDEIGKLQPQLTVVDGKIVFVHTDFSKEYSLQPDGAVVSTYQDLIKRRNRMRGVSLGG